VNKILYSYLIRTFIVTQINKLLTLTSSMKLSMYLLLIVRIKYGPVYMKLHYSLTVFSPNLNQSQPIQINQVLLAMAMIEACKCSNDNSTLPVSINTAFAAGGAMWDEELNKMVKYRDLINHDNPATKDRWLRSGENEFARLFQGYGETDGMDVLEWVH
jgi:hypothetical protein